MSFYREVGNLLGLDWARIANGYSIVNYNGEAVYIEGISKMASLSESEIVVDAGKTRIKVEGVDLFVVSLEDKTMVVRGDIKFVGEVMAV